MPLFFFPRACPAGLMSYVGGALSSVMAVVGTVVKAGTPATAPKPTDHVLASCCGHMGSGCPPHDSLVSPVRLPFSTRVAVILLAFYDGFCCSSEGLWLAAGANTWRGVVDVAYPCCSSRSVKEG